MTDTHTLTSFFLTMSGHSGLVVGNGVDVSGVDGVDGVDVVVSGVDGVDGVDVVASGVDVVGVGVGDDVGDGTLPKFMILDEVKYYEWKKNYFPVNNVYWTRPVGLYELTEENRGMICPDLNDNDNEIYDNYVTYPLHFPKITFTTDDVEKGDHYYDDDDYDYQNSYTFRLKFEVNNIDVIITIKATLDNDAAGDCETIYTFEKSDYIHIDTDNKVIKENIGWIIDKMEIVEIETNDYDHSDSVWELQYKS